MTQRLHRKFGNWLLHHALEFKWFYLGAFVCLYILQVLQSQIPERIRNLTKSMSGEEMNETSVLIFLGLALGILVFRTFSRLLFFYPARVQQKFLRNELLETLERVSPTRYKERNQGQIFQILFDDINNLRAFVGFGLLQIGNLIIAAWVLIPKLNQTDAYLWPAFLPLFSSIGLFTFFIFVNQKYFKKMMDSKGEVQQFIIESYEAKQTIKNFHREESFIKGFAKASADELSLFFKYSAGFAVTNPYIKLGLGASLLWAALLIRKNGGGTSDLVFFSGFLYLFLEPVMFMSWVAVVISQGFAAWKRVKELHAKLIVPSTEELQVANQHFVITDKTIELLLPFWDQSLPLSVQKGRWTVVIGETGSGKSYLLGQFATTLILKGFKVSMVQQEPYLFNDTIEQNIFLGHIPNLHMKNKAIELLKIFQLDGLASTLDEVLALEVGENGKRLSGGQMKRVALIRSLLSEAEMIVWDDPFSSVDIILERKIISQLKMTEEWGRKTFLLSSHRLTTVKMSDEIIFVEKNTGIISQGKTENLLREEDVAKFFKEQMVDLSLA